MQTGNVLQLTRKGKESFVKNRNFSQKSKFLSKLEIFVKTGNFRQNSKFYSKCEIFVKTRHCHQKIKFLSKAKFSSKLEIFVKTRKITFQSNLQPLKGPGALCDASCCLRKQRKFVEMQTGNFLQLYSIFAYVEHCRKWYAIACYGTNFSTLISYNIMFSDTNGTSFQ